MKKVNVAWVEIWHPISDTSVSTVKERADNEAEAVEQFQRLNNLISSWESPYNGLILETSSGLIRFPATFLTESLLKLHFQEETSYEDEINDDSSGS